LAKRLTPQGVDNVMVVDDMGALPIVAPTSPGMGHDEGTTQKRLDAIIVEVNAFRQRRTFGSTTLPDQLRRRAVEDAFDQEATCPGDRHHDLGEVCRPPLRQRLQMRSFRLDGIGPLFVPPRHQHVDEAPVAPDAGEVMYNLIYWSVMGL
jgi:hypothetical protein